MRPQPFVHVVEELLRDPSTSAASPFRTPALSMSSALVALAHAIDRAVVDRLHHVALGLQLARGVITGPKPGTIRVLSSLSVSSRSIASTRPPIHAPVK